VRRPRKRVEDTSTASDMREEGDGRYVDGQSVGKIETARLVMRVRCYTYIP